MNDVTFLAFSDEFVKIAFYKKLLGGFKNVLSEGWHGGTPEQLKRDRSLPRGERVGATWFGKGRHIKPGMSRGGRMLEEATSLGGLTRALPVGAKSMMLLGTGLMARDALRPTDPTGQERSRSERVTGLAGNTIGGLAGAAIANRVAPGSFLGSIAGGIGGGMIGEKLLSKPFAAARQHRQAAAQQQQQMYQQYPQSPPQQIEGVPA